MYRIIHVAVLALSLLLQLFPIHAENDSFTCGFSYVGTHDKNAMQNEKYPFQNNHSIHLTGWKNDLVYAKIVIEASEEMEVSISHGAFKNETDTLNDSQIEYGLLEEANASLGIGYDASIPHVSIPEIITDTKEFSIPTNQTKYVWIRITLPNDQKEGVYKGCFIIQGNSQKEELNVVVSVLPYTLENIEDEYSINLWQYPFSSLRYYDVLQNEEAFSKKHLDVLKEELKLYKEAGGNSITVTVLDEAWGHQTYDDYPSMVDWIRNPDYSITFDYSKFDAWVNLCMECGIDARIDTFSILPFDNAVTYVFEDGSRVRYPMRVGSDEWKDVWTYFLTTYIEHLESKGWFEKTFIFIDEREMNDVIEAIQLIKSIKNSKGESLKIASAINRVPNNESIYDEVDYLSIAIAATPHQDPSFERFIQHRHELGLETTLYNCSTNYPNAFTISEPDESIWTMEYMGINQFTGYLRWALNAWNENPYQTLDYQHFEAGDIFLIYPDYKDATSPKPRRTIRLDMIIYGLRNSMKYQYLKENLPSSLKSQFEKEFEEMDRSYGYFNSYGSMVGSEQASITISEEVLKQESLLNKYSRLLKLKKIMEGQ